MPVSPKIGRADAPEWMWCLQIMAAGATKKRHQEEEFDGLSV
jgi:hypothetical protein